MADVARALDAIVRRERGVLLGGLLRQCGSIDLAEEGLQDAIVAALATWPATGIPDSPAAWLATAAKNRVRDAQRHQAVVAHVAPRLAEVDMAVPTMQTIADDQLRLIFTCCHPELPRDGHVALTLKVIAGFSVEQLARAYVVPEATMAQRIVRAKRTIDERGLAYAVPTASQLGERLATVLEVVYLIFNEGHTSSHGDLVRLDLQAEALRLGRLLGELAPREPEVFGLLALIVLSAARASTRTDQSGALLRLAEQDRSKWHVALVEEGLAALSRAHSLGGTGSYVLQAEIAAYHVTAPTFEATDWGRVIACYDALLELTHSPIVALNRAIAISMASGPERALAELGDLEEPLARYHLFYATRAELLGRLGHDARADYKRALALATNEAERAFIERRLAST
jgi:RNA polymerase sigma-70 factor (ECF subfamily)